MYVRSQNQPEKRLNSASSYPPGPTQMDPIPGFSSLKPGLREGDGATAGSLLNGIGAGSSSGHEGCGKENEKAHPPHHSHASTTPSFQLRARCSGGDFVRVGALSLGSDPPLGFTALQLRPPCLPSSF